MREAGWMSAAVAVMIAGAGYLFQHGATVEAAAPAPLSAGDAEQAARRLALKVRTVTCEGIGTGSGFAVGHDMLVTNRHVIEGASRVRFDRGDGLSIEAGAIAAAYTHDLAIVTLDRPIPEIAPLAERDPSPGAAVLVAGFPHGGPLQLSHGTVIDTALDPEGVEVLRLSAAVAPGSSGSPVFDARGELVAVIYATEIPTGHALAIPVSALRATVAYPPAAVATTTGC
jgi:S1-C subfamily serine protease